MKPKIFLGIVLVIFFLTRLANLLLLPVFNDELLYLQMGKWLVHSPINNLFIGFVDGKEPLYFWFLAIFLKLFPDQLLAGRLLSVASGFFGLVIFLALAKEVLPDKKTMTIAVLAVLFSPFLFFYQRLAILDSLLVMLLTVVLYKLVIFIKTPSKINAVILGLFAGLCLITKSNSIIFLVSLLPFLIFQKTPKKSMRLLLLIFVVSLVVFAPVFLHPQYALLSHKNLTFILSFQDFIKNPLALFLLNLKLALRWLISYQGWPMIVVGLVTPLLVIKERRIKAFCFSIMVFLPIIFESFIAKVFFPRYFLFIIIPLSLLVGEFFVWLDEKQVLPVVKMALFVGIFFPGIFLMSELIYNPATASLHPTERWQYISGWPAGYGLLETASFLKDKRAEEIIVEDIVAMKFGLPYFLGRSINYQLLTTDQIKEEDKKRAFVVFTQRQKVPVSWQKNLVFEYWRPGNEEKISVYHE